MKELIGHRTLLPAFERWATKSAFHDGDYHATYGEHGERALRLADAMHHELGIQRGDRFAVMSCNSHQYLELFHAGRSAAGNSARRLPDRPQGIPERSFGSCVWRVQSQRRLKVSRAIRVRCTTTVSA